MILIRPQLCSIDQSDLFIPGTGEKNQSSTSFPFYSFRLTIPCILTFERLQPARVSLQYKPGKMLLVKSTDLSAESNLSMPCASISFVHKHVVFLFVFVCFCLPPVPPPPPPTHNSRGTPRLVSCRTPRPC